MDKPYYQMSKSELRVMMQAFASVAAANAATLGLNPANVTEINNQQTLYAATVTEQQNAQAAARGAVADCTAEKADTIELIGRYAAIFKANPAVSDELIAQLGLPPRNNGGDHLPVYDPANLAATGCSNGVNKLNWERNGNFPGVTYLIEAAYDGTTDWELIDAVSKTRYEHTDQTPGREVSYRVFAKRRNLKSGPSNTATIYLGGGGQALTLRAA
jgi:hypothetical protein